MAIRARDRGGPPIALQVLVYPVTDADFDRPSYTDPENELLLTRDGMILVLGPLPSRVLSPHRAGRLLHYTPRISRLCHRLLY